MLLIWKAFQCRVQWCFRFWNIFFCVGEIEVFVLCKLATWWRHVDQWKMRKYLFNNISGNICGVIFKLGTINLSQKGSKMTPVLLLPWQQFFYWSFLNIKWNSCSFFTTKIMYIQKSIEEPLWQYWKYVCSNRDPLSHFWSLQIEVFVFRRKGLEPSRLPWQPSYRIHFVRCLIWISTTPIFSVGGLMVSALDSGSNGPSSSLGQGTALCS